MDTIVDYNKLIAGKENAVLIIIESMKKFPDNSEFQILACRTLTGLAFGGKNHPNYLLLTTSSGIQQSINHHTSFTFHSTESDSKQKKSRPDSCGPWLYRKSFHFRNL
jgi:hypothetical protein